MVGHGERLGNGEAATLIREEIGSDLVEGPEKRYRCEKWFDATGNGGESAGERSVVDFFG